MKIAAIWALAVVAAAAVLALILLGDKPPSCPAPVAPMPAPVPVEYGER